MSRAFRATPSASPAELPNRFRLVAHKIVHDAASVVMKNPGTSHRQNDAGSIVHDNAIMSEPLENLCVMVCNMRYLLPPRSWLESKGSAIGRAF